MSTSLSVEQKNELKKLHKQECYRRHADRIKVILLLDLGLSHDDIARYLLLDDQTIRNYEKRYQSSGVKALLSDNYVGCASKLTSEQEELLKNHLRENAYSTAKEIVEYVKQTFGVIYTPEGMVHTLNRLHFTYKKTTAVPCKADPEKQKEFTAGLRKVKRKKYHQIPAENELTLTEQWMPKLTK